MSRSTCLASSRAIWGGLPAATTGVPSKGDQPASQRGSAGAPKAAASLAVKAGMTGWSATERPTSAFPIEARSAWAPGEVGASQGFPSCTFRLQTVAAALTSRMTSRNSWAR